MSYDLKTRWDLFGARLRATTQMDPSLTEFIQLTVETIDNIYDDQLDGAYKRQPTKTEFLYYEETLRRVLARNPWIRYLTWESYAETLLYRSRGTEVGSRLEAALRNAGYECSVEIATGTGLCRETIVCFD